METRMCTHVHTYAYTVALNKGREGLLQHRLQEDISLSTPFFPPQTRTKHQQVSGAVSGPGHKTDTVPTPGAHILVRKKKINISC